MGGKMGEMGEMGEMDEVDETMGSTWLRGRL
jgi:hypothetical protein